MEQETKKIAIVRANDVGISTKQSIEISRFIKGKKIEQAVKELNEVIKMKKALPMRGEIPHKTGYSGRYPIKASKVFVKLLQNLEANAGAKGVDSSNARIFAKADRASRPRKMGKFGGRKFKRTHILITLQ